MYDYCGVVFVLKQKTDYELRISDWSSDVCSSDLSMTVMVSAPIPVTIAVWPYGSQLNTTPSPGCGPHVVDTPHGLLSHICFAKLTGHTAWVPYMAISEERRDGKECVRPCRSRWSPIHKKNTNKQ